MLKFIINISFVLFCVLLQLSFIPFLIYPFNNLNLVLCIIIFITAIVSYKMGLWIAFSSGLMLGLYSFFPFGLINIFLIITAILINFFFNNFFTHRSLNSLIILGLIGTAFYNISLLIANSIIFFIGQQRDIFNFLNIQFFYNLIWQIILNLVVLSLMFLILNFIVKQLKSVFLFPK